MYEDLRIIIWPDPRLLKVSQEVTTFDATLAALAARMLELMREARGVGLAAPQVGENIRMFVMNPTGEPADDRIYINPVLTVATGDEESEEGCLSLPGINVKVVRAAELRLQARSVEGIEVNETGSGYIARIWQHETDHLDGVLLLDKMGPVQRLASRRILKELQVNWDEAHPPAKGRSRG